MKKFSLIFAVLFSLILSAEDANLLRNAALTAAPNRNPAQWQCVFPAGSFRIVTLNDGSKFVQFGKGLETQQCMLIQRDLPLEAGKKYIFSCEVQSAGANSSVMIYAEWRIPQADGKFRHASVNARPFSPADEWQTVAFEIPARPGNSEKPYLVISVPSGKINLRNLILTEVE